VQILAARGGLGNECAYSSMAVADSNSCLYTLPAPYTVDKQNVYSSGTTILKSAKYGSTLVQASDRAVTSKFVRVVSASITCRNCKQQISSLLRFRALNFFQICIQSVIVYVLNQKY